MSLSIEEKKAIIAYRIQKAKATMIEAQDNARLGHWNLVSNRLYYAAFHMISALLTDKGLFSKTHNGVICLFGQAFVEKELVSKEDARLVSRLPNMRKSGDYDDLFDWTEEDVVPLIDRTEQLLLKIEKLISLKNE